MAIKRFGDYDEVKTYSESGEMLPRGGYVCKILDAKVVENSYGSSIKVAFDICEGEHKDYYLARYTASTREDKKWPGTFLINLPRDDGSEKDGWAKRRFKTFIECLEESNDGYHFDWDEKKFANKIVGMVFNYRQWEYGGNVGMTPNPARPATVAAIREGKFKIPEDKLLKAQPAPSIPAGFTQIDGGDTELPF